MNNTKFARFGEQMREEIANEIELNREIAQSAGSLSNGQRNGIPDNTDWDDLTTPGNYYVGTAANMKTMSNVPTLVPCMLFVFSTINGERIYQICVESHSQSNDIYKRYYNGTAWSEWDKLANDRIIGNIMPARTSGTTIINGMTIVSDGNGSYKISGTATETSVYNIFNNAENLPMHFKPGQKLFVKVDSPSRNTQFRIAYYKSGGTNPTTLVYAYYNSVCKIPEDAVGLTLRFQFVYGTGANAGLNSPEFELHPEIYVLDSISEAVNADKQSTYPPMLSIIDDDGHYNYYRDLYPLNIGEYPSSMQNMQGLPAFEPIPIASAVVTGYMSNRENYMTWDQVKEAYSAGCEILSHGLDHQTDDDILEHNTSALILERKYRASKHDLMQHGVNTEILVFNNNTANVIQCQQAARKSYRCALHAAGARINYPETTNPYRVERFNFTHPTTGTIPTLQDMKDNIDELIAAGTGWDVWMIHTSSTNADAGTGWNDGKEEVEKIVKAVNYAREHGVQVVTIQYGMRRYLGIDA